MAFLWFVFLSPLYQSIGSGSWPQTECKILKSQVQDNSDSDGNSYKPIVEYEYTVDGIKYFGDSPTFEDISARRKWAISVVAKYTVGETSKCYYDPDDHATSVLDPTFLWTFYAMALFPLIFVAIGLGLIYAAVSNSKEPKPANSLSGDACTKASLFGGPAPGQAAEAADLVDQQWSVPKRLARNESRWLGLLVIGVFAGFWNTFIGFWIYTCLLYTSPSPRDKRQSRMPSSA